MEEEVLDRYYKECQRVLPLLLFLAQIPPSLSSPLNASVLPEPHFRPFSKGEKQTCSCEGQRVLCCSSLVLVCGLQVTMPYTFQPVIFIVVDMLEMTRGGHTNWSKVA